MPSVTEDKQHKNGGERFQCTDAFSFGRSCGVLRVDGQDVGDILIVQKVWRRFFDVARQVVRVFQGLGLGDGISDWIAVREPRAPCPSCLGKAGEDRDLSHVV